MNTMKKYDVIALGELLIDFTDSGASEQGNPTFEANAGGAPCNVLAMLAKFGHTTAFIGKVGDDIFGNMLRQTLTELNIDTQNLILDSEVRTTLAFVKNDAGGERSFSFYRNPGADMMLRADEINEELIKSAKIFHFGTLSMTHDGVRAATERAVNTAKNNRLLISFDPNLRESLWDSLDSAGRMTEYGLGVCDILKISDNELRWITGTENYDEGVSLLRKKYNIPLVLLTLGREGSRAYYGSACVSAPAILRDDTVDTTGAGDTFLGCCLHFLLENGIDGLTEQDLARMLTLANSAASVITSKKGALRVMPEPEELEAF